MGGKGHIQHRGGDSYRLMLFVGRVDGRQRFLTRTVRGSLEDAERALMQWREEVEEGGQDGPPPPSRPKRSGPTDVAKTRGEILAAARRCYRRNGVNGTTMDDVAREAGLTRSHLYRFVSGRTELRETVTITCLHEVIQMLRPVGQDAASPLDGIIDLSVAAIEAVRRDTELNNLFETSNPGALHELLAGPNPELQALALRLFEPVLDAAVAAGVLRGDVTHGRILDWLRGVFLMLILRRDLDAAGERELIRDFVIPSLRPL